MNDAIMTVDAEKNVTFGGRCCSLLTLHLIEVFFFNLCLIGYSCHAQQTAETVPQGAPITCLSLTVYRLHALPW